MSDQASFAHGAMTDMVVGPDRYVAVGCATMARNLEDHSCSGASWTSADALTWVRGAVPTADHLYLDGVITSPVGYLTWAYDVGEHPGAAFWVSADGVDWRRAPTIASFAYANPDDAVWFGDRFVARSGSHLWTSPNGLDWTDLPAPSDCRTDQVAPDPIDGLTVFRGALFAWATTDTAQGGYRRVTATSSDGVCWTRSETPSDGWLTSVIPVGDRLVGAGSKHSGPDAGAGSPPPPGAAWTSLDGASWTSAAIAPAAPADALSPIAAGARGLVGLGTSAAGRAAVWRSADGSSWAEATSAPTNVSAIVGTPFGFVAVGRTEPCPLGDCAPGPCGCVDTAPVAQGVHVVVWVAR